MERRFEEAYTGRPPWDIGRPQPALAAIVDRGLVAGEVLDVGCGTGELALHLAAHGCDAWGVDLVGSAIDRARAKAAERGLHVHWRVHDALRLGEMGETFDAVMDSGVFHVFDDIDRARYVASLATALRPGGDYWMLVFSDKETTDWGGPRRISEREIRDAFQDGWHVESIEAARFEANIEIEGHAWLAHVVRGD